MNAFEIYVHGTPRGHQIWGSEHNQDYISTFYNHDARASEKVVFQIDICSGDSFYTYMRQQNVYDVEGRPRAFFALTVCFRKTFCTNVYRLYQLFDAVYSQICVGTILKQSGNGESYLVADLTVARSGANTTVDRIQAAFAQKVSELIVPTVQPISTGDTFNRQKKIISLLEVDSPLFFDCIKKYSVIVSPEMPPAALAYDAVSNELKQASAHSKALCSSNEKLQSEIAALSQENKSLSNQLQASVSSTEKKYKNKLEQLQSDLIKVAKERDSLKHKIGEAASSIELIDQPFQKLTRLLAVRFPEDRSLRSNDSMGDKQVVIRKNQNPIWLHWLNSVLLGFVLVCCFTILFLVLKSQGNEDIERPHSDGEYSFAEISSDTIVQEKLAEVITEESTPTYDSWDACFLNIKNGGDTLSLNKPYTLSITKQGEPANVPKGYWSVYINKGELINKGDSLIITDPAYRGQNIMIEYIVDGKTVKTRVCKIL